MDEKILFDPNENDLIPSDLLINYQQRLRFLHRQNQQLQEHLDYLQSRMNNQLLVTEGEIQLNPEMQKIRSDDEMKLLKSLVFETQHDVFEMRRKNEELRNRVEELEEVIQIERERSGRLLAEDQKIIKCLRTRLNDLEENFQQIMSSKPSFDNQSSFHSDYGEERTMFEQVYGTRQRRPQMIQLIVPWKTSNHRPLQISQKAVTPPSSDYTDAYLAAFAPKPIRVRHLQRLTTPAFVPVPQISRQLPPSRPSSIHRPWSWGHFTYVPSYSFDLSLLPKTPPSRHYTRTLLSPPNNEQKPDRPGTLPLLSESMNTPTKNLLNKYETMINQISEVLATVSPLSSTLSSLSPGKSALDFDLSEENSPKCVHPLPTIQSTPVEMRKKSSHLIREDSYDKIVHVMADLDSELPPTVMEEDHEMSILERGPSSPNQIDQPISYNQYHVNEEHSSSSLSSETSSRPSSDAYVLPLPITYVVDEQDPWIDTQTDDRRFPRRSSSSLDQSSSFSDSLEPHSSHHEPVTSSDEPASIGIEPVRLRSILPPAIPLIISPIESLSDSIARRYISSDVYHGYLGGQWHSIEDDRQQVDSSNLINGSSEKIEDDRILLSSAETVIETSRMFLSPQQEASDSGSISLEMSSTSSSSSSSSSSACLKPPAEYHEQSSNNTEADSLELLRILRGHSTVVTQSPSASSSQIIHSDPYVSFAIHQLGDSSQERLPSLPLAADLPVYKPPIPPRSSLSKEDDQTDCDATENLASFTDDLLLQRLHHHIKRDQYQHDISSTDEDIEDEPYQRYDLPRTLSHDDSQPSSQQQTDNVYLIPGYPGLWRTSVNHDETKTQITSSNEPQSENIFVENSETESFHTCMSSQSQPMTTTTSDEGILLIRQCDRGISLPISMKIDSTHLPAQRLSMSISNEVPLDQIKSNEQTRQTFQKSSKGPISISECDDQGLSITIENTSPSKDIDLNGWMLRQENEYGDVLTFVFPQACLLHANDSLKIWCTRKSSDIRSDDLIATDVLSWHKTSHLIVTLINVEGQERARLIKKTISA